MVGLLGMLVDEHIKSYRTPGFGGFSTSEHHLIQLVCPNSVLPGVYFRCVL